MMKEWARVKAMKKVGSTKGIRVVTLNTEHFSLNFVSYSSVPGS